MIRHESYAPPCNFPCPLTQMPGSKYQKNGMNAACPDGTGLPNPYQAFNGPNPIWAVAPCARVIGPDNTDAASECGPAGRGLV